MARTVRDANLETRAARGRIKARKKPYYRTIDQGAHLGYYKGTRAGSWLARYFIGEGRYAETTLGKADDATDADGVAVLSYRQAQEKARAWFAEQARRGAGVEPAAGPYTVADAMRNYLAWYADHKKALADTRTAAEAHILPALGETLVAALTTAAINKWHLALATAPARLRSRRGGAARHMVRHRPTPTPSAAARPRRTVS